MKQGDKVWWLYEEKRGWGGVRRVEATYVRSTAKRCIIDVQYKDGRIERKMVKPERMEPQMTQGGQEMDIDMLRHVVNTSPRFSSFSDVEQRAIITLSTFGFVYYLGADVVPTEKGREMLRQDDLKTHNAELTRLRGALEKIKSRAEESLGEWLPVAFDHLPVDLEEYAIIRGIATDALEGNHAQQDSD